MSYNILKTNGNLLVSIADGLADTSQSSLTLFGKNYTGYGPQLDENQVHMLENFAYTSAPANALEGQLWWDTNSKLMKVRKDSAWKAVSGPTPASSAPFSDTAGDLWWDTTKKQLNVFNGSDWMLTGPAYSTAQGVAGQVVDTVPGAYDALYHNIVKFYLNGSVVAILSKDPTFDVNVIAGFTTLRPGFNLPSGNSQYVGNAENALSLGGIAAANYLRSDVASESNFPVSIKNDGGLTVGVDDDFTIRVQSGAAVLQSNTEDNDVVFNVNVGGINTQVMRFDGADGRVTIGQTPIDSTGVANKEYVDTTVQIANDALIAGAPPAMSTLFDISAALGDDASFAANNTAAHNLLAPTLSPALTGTPTAPTAAANNDTTQIATTEFVNDRLAALSGQTLAVGILESAGGISGTTVTVSSAILATTNGTIDIGTISNSFRTLYGQSTSAVYADLAENYVANANYEPGTVLDFGGAYEVCQSITDSSRRVAGVVSTNPAYLMNSACTGEFVVAVALQGRCPVKVTGKIYPGALLVSAGNGHARAEESPAVGTVIGKAIGSFDGESGIIEVSISRC